MDFQPASSSVLERSKLDSRKVVNVIIAKDFNFAQEDVQIQALEVRRCSPPTLSALLTRPQLMRRRRIFSRTTVHLAPSVFLLLPLVAITSKQIRLNKHLVSLVIQSCTCAYFKQNDRIFMSHFHSVEDGFPNLEELDETASSAESDPAYSYPRSLSGRRQEMIASRRIDAEVRSRLLFDVSGSDRHVQLLEHFRAQGQATTITPEIRRYLQDVVVFLRMERGVDGGVSPYATTLFVALAKSVSVLQELLLSSNVACRYLAPFHGIDYVTPSLVALAAKKVYPHRIIIALPSRERSTQYGTDLSTAFDLVNDLDAEKVIQNVLDRVDCPT